MADNMAASAVRLSTSDHVSLRSTLIFLNAARMFQHLRFQSVLACAYSSRCSCYIVLQYHTCVMCSKALKAREIFVRNLPKSRFNGIKRFQLMQQRMKNELHQLLRRFPPSDFSPSVLAAPFGRCCDPHASLLAP